MELLDWYATEDHEPPQPPTIKVWGTCRFPTPGWTASLRPTEGNTGINPRMLHLDLVVASPSGPVIQPVEDVPVTPYEAPVLDGPNCQYDEVQIHVVGVDAPGTVLKVACTS